MKIDDSGGRVRVTFEARGWARILIVVFLLFWLAGWAVGEWFAVRGLAWAVQGGRESPAFRALTQPVGWILGGFIVLWIVLWTIGGAVALLELGRLLAGRDELTITPPSGSFSEEWGRSECENGFRAQRSTTSTSGAGTAR